MIDGEIRIGIVLNAHTDECYYAWEGGGSFLNGRPIRVSQTSAIGDALIATGFPYKIQDVAPLIRTLGYFMRYARGIRRYGAAALDLAYVASGRFDVYYETTLNSWDVAGGILLVQEAGGKVSSFDKQADPLFARSIIATNDKVYDEVVRIIDQNFV